KDRKEPTHCTKCQSFNHIAKNCKAEHDICGTCSDQHHTSACNSFCMTQCVNCRSQQHMSWSHSCLEFSRCCREINEKYLENCMPYFPT
ncbi:uncharacterized protein BJ212DRAFT_1226753, partial [Suillus subaureus]